MYSYFFSESVNLVVSTQFARVLITILIIYVNQKKASLSTCFFTNLSQIAGKIKSQTS